MNRIANQILAVGFSIALLLSCVWTVFPAAAGDGGALGESAGGQTPGPAFSPVLLDSMPVNVFYQVAVEKTEESTDSTFYTGETVVVKMDFSAGNLQPGDYTVVMLPDELKVINAQDFTLTNEGGLPIATASISSGQNSITVTFNDNVSGLSNVRGRLTYTASINADGIDGAGTYKLEFLENNTGSCHTDLYIEESTGTNLYRPIYKFVDINAEGVMYWTVYVNFEQKNLTNVVVTDMLDAGHVLEDGSITVTALFGLVVDDTTFTYSGSKDVTGQVGIDLTANGFTVDFGDITGGYRITYRSTITDPSVKTYKNTAYFDADELDSTPYWWASIYRNYDGSASGDRNGSLKLVKVDEETGEKLSGAAFDLLAEDDSVAAKLVTGMDGTDTAGSLEIGATYYLVETKAPAGYTLGQSGPVAVLIDGQDEVEVKITNTKEKEPAPDPGDKDSDGDDDKDGDGDGEGSGTEEIPEPDGNGGETPAPDGNGGGTPGPGGNGEEAPGPDGGGGSAGKPGREASVNNNAPGGSDKADNHHPQVAPDVLAPPVDVTNDEETGAAVLPPANSNENPSTGAVGTLLPLFVLLSALGGAVLLKR